jgi:hypothetical protein
MRTNFLESTGTNQSILFQRRQPSLPCICIDTLQGKESLAYSMYAEREQRMYIIVLSERTTTYLVISETQTTSDAASRVDGEVLAHSSAKNLKEGRDGTYVRQVMAKS